MASVRDHYSQLLGQHYHHLAPSLEDATRSLVSLGVPKAAAGGGWQAIDLGSGTGVYTKALNGLGYRAEGLDTCSALVAKARGDYPDCQFYESDILVYQPAHPLNACLLLGDTVRHLPTLTSVHSLVVSLASRIVPGGVWLTSFQDNDGLKGEERFVDVIASEELTMSSFVERDGDYELVTDLVRARADGWRLQKSRYRKLIIKAVMLQELFAAQGFDVVVSRAPCGMTTVLATKL